MNALTEKFVEEHASDNLDRLLLNASKYPDVDVAWAVHQIDARRRMGAKLPSWVKNTKLRFPIRLSMEQCSSERTAVYKSTLCEGEVIAEDGYSIYAAGDAVVNINGGYYFSWVTAIDARKDAQVTINNGVFEVDGSTNPDGDFGQVFTLNLRDKKNSYVTDKSNIIVKGGEFYNYNPSASMSENPIADFVAPGYRVVNKESGVDMTEPHDASGEDIWYKVVK